KLTGTRVPPAEGTSSTFVNALVPIANNASHFPSGDQTGFGESTVSAKTPVDTTRSAFVASSTTCSSRRLRRYASRRPSGEKTGDKSVAAPEVRASDAPVVKS